ncbi:hypothetical protein Clacol_001176 [Clathrus columnatus]|uniref:DUF7514 domain-containing protein n=1 Tax=Clathrus columnatus TaxID=1419009 RepID=A0AAV5A0H6_9AGAM|nr:hypothetical protein Clacol_001176 [Clathrus columnatus]
MAFEPINVSSQDPNPFYGSLLDSEGLPSQILCRMSDSLFFYLDKYCPVNPGSGYIEPDKVFWREIAVGEDMDIVKTGFLLSGGLIRKLKMQNRLDSNRQPLLDRRGYLHVIVFEIKSNPDDAFNDWNRLCSTLKLVDPLTGLLFPTPIPRSAFPEKEDTKLHAIYEQWRNGMISRIEAANTPQTSQTQSQTSSNTPALNAQEYRKALKEKEKSILRTQLMSAGIRTAMNIFNNNI